MSTCPLCKQDAEIIKSHLIPSWAYKMISGDDPPILIDTNNSRSVFSDKEFKKPLLCHSCDNMKFGKIENKIRKLLSEKNWPESAIKNRLSYAVEFYPEIKIEIIKYFAISVIWRSHHMRMGVNLGPYENAIRDYLYGESSSLESMAFCSSFVDYKGEKSHLLFSLPTTTRNNNVHTHGFNFFNFKLMLIISKQIPEFVLNAQYINSLNHMLLIESSSSKDLANIENSVRKSEPKGKLNGFYNEKT